MVYPEMPETFWSFKHSLRFIGKKATFPPLSLLTVAALLPERYDATIVDMNVRRLSRRDIEAADIVFVSAMLVQKESLERVIRRCKELGKPVVAGGPYPTSSHASIEGVDHFVLNEAEVTLPDFIRDWEAGAARKVYSSDERPDLSRSPAPRYDLIDMRPYSAMMLQYSRGCPFDCEFCEIVELFGRAPRVKGTEQFIGEIDGLRALGYRGDVFIVDDNFIGNKRSIKELLRALAAWQEANGRPFRFYTQASIDLAADDELLGLMAATGFTMAFVGIETPVEASLELAHKKQNLGISLTQSVHRIQERGIEVTGGFILGFDSDPADIADRQIELIRESGITTAMVGLLTALPGTRLYRRLEAEGRILGESTGNNTLSLELNFEPKMDRARLVGSYVEVLKAIYDPRAYFDRCLSLLRRLPELPSTNRGFGDARSALTNVRAFLRSLVAQTFSPYGLQYLRFLARALRETPRVFPKAVEMAIFGHNLFKTTRKYVGKAWRDSRTAARSFARSEAMMRRLGARAAPEGFEALLGQLIRARSRLAAVVRIEDGKIPLIAIAERALSSLAASIEALAADRYRRLIELMRASDDAGRILYSKAIARYRRAFVDAEQADTVPKSAYHAFATLARAIDAMVADIASLAPATAGA